MHPEGQHGLDATLDHNLDRQTLKRTATLNPVASDASMVGHMVLLQVQNVVEMPHNDELTLLEASR